MKRKLFNAALFGAVLVAAPVSTFVSCADYDADFETVNKQIETLGDLVNQKEAVILEQIKALEEMDKALAEKEAELDKAIKNCPIECAEKIDACKAECAAARANLQKSIDDLENAIKDCQAKDGELAAQDVLLQKGIDEANAALTAAVKRIENLEDGLSNTQDDVRNLTEGLTGVRGDIKTINEKLTSLENLLGEKVKELNKAIGDAKSELDGKIAANKTLIEELTKVVNKNSEDVEKLFEGLDATQEDVRNLVEGIKSMKGQIAELDGKVDAHEQSIVSILLRLVDLEKDQDALKEAYDKYTELRQYTDKQIDDFIKEAEKNLNTKIDNVESTLNTKVDNVESTLNTKISNVETAYKNADSALGERIDNVITDVNNFKTEVAALGVALSKEVKGLVLEPASYYEGIQAIEGVSYEYTKWNVSEARNPQQSGDYVKYCPEVTAYYHINPSNALLSTDVANYAYAVLDRENRGVNTELAPVVTAVAQDKGMLAVTLKLGNAAANKTPEGHEDPSVVTVMALQYTNPAAKAENQVITSDYGVLFLNPLKEVSLVSANDTDHELTDVYANVVSNNDQDWVEYTQTYNITEQIKAKFGGENAVTVSDAKWPAGFSYEYTIVDGDASNFKCEVNEDGQYIVTPQLINGKPATTACVGKNATWRIDVKHGDDVVEVGFFKLTITGEAIIETAPAVVTDDILKVTCEHEDEALNKNLSLENVWNKIAEVTGEDLVTVKGDYSVSLFDGKVAQFEQYTGENDRVLYKQFGGKGTIILKEDGTVNWTVIDNDPYVETDLRSLTKDMKSMTTYIRVRSNNAISKDTYNEFYLPLVWTPKPIEFWGESQELSWSYTRVNEQWQAGQKAGEKEIRLYTDLTDPNVGYKFDIPAKAMTGFKYDALTFVGSAKDFVNVKNKAILPENGHFCFVNHPDEDARFYDVVAEDGNNDTYEITVGDEGQSLYAARGKEYPTKIATISEQGLIELINTPVTQKLINAYEKDDLAYGHTLCARVGFAATCCAGNVEVIDGDFDVRFIKPITVNVKPITISDADDVNEAGIYTKSILDNIVCFNGYTLEERRDTYFDLFGISTDLGDVKDWKTNYGAASETDFTSTLGQKGIANLFGTEKDANENDIAVTYKNNTAVVNKFVVLVPITVTHKWNNIETVIEVPLTIERTRANANRR